MRCYAQGDAIDLTVLLRETPMRLTSVEEYARRSLARPVEEPVLAGA
jgi:hypothetical protein